MKRILHIFKSYFPDTVGGIEEAIKNIVNSTHGHLQHTILTLSDSYKEEKMGNLRVIRLPTTFSISSCPFSFPLMREYASIIQEFDLLHYHFPWPCSEIVQVLLNIQKPYIVTYHSDIVKQKILKQFYRPFLRNFLVNAKRIVVTSQNYLNTSEDLKAYLKKCTVIPLGIPDLPKFNTERLEYWKKEVGENFLLFIGVLRYYKGLNHLLDAMKGKTIPLVIAGDGPCRTSLEKQARSNHLTSLQFIGKISDEDKVALLKLCRGVILPSNQRSEAFGIALLEGLAAGKPLISLEIGTGTSFINKAGETGWVVSPNSKELLAKAMDSLFFEEQLVQKFSKAARERFEKFFTCEEMGKSYLKVYEEHL